MDDNESAIVVSRETVTHEREGTMCQAAYLRSLTHILLRAARFSEVLDNVPTETGIGEVKAYLTYFRGLALYGVGSKNEAIGVLEATRQLAIDTNVPRVVQLAEIRLREY